MTGKAKRSAARLVALLALVLLGLLLAGSLFRGHLCFFGLGGFFTGFRHQLRFTGAFRRRGVIDGSFLRSCLCPDGQVLCGCFLCGSFGFCAVWYAMPEHGTPMRR